MQLLIELTFFIYTTEIYILINYCFNSHYLHFTFFLESIWHFQHLFIYFSTLPLLPILVCFALPSEKDTILLRNRFYDKIETWIRLVTNFCYIHTSVPFNCITNPSLIDFRMPIGNNWFIGAVLVKLGNNERFFSKAICYAFFLYFLR